ncbi:MAG: ATP-dependent Clp protease adaptor ClpS [Chitinophagales bacterium]
MSNVLTEEKIETGHLIDTLFGHNLVVYNDEINTFDWVIQSLVEICRHTWEQAEQCALIIHYNGKYAVKQGELRNLKPMREALTERGINAVIE